MPAPMARPFPPHFVGWFGITCPIVVGVLNAMRLPTAIKRMPAPYRDGLLASLACDLSERFKLGIALGILNRALEPPFFDQLCSCRPLWVLAVESYYLKREGCSIREPGQSDVNYLSAPPASTRLFRNSATGPN